MLARTTLAMATVMAAGLAPLAASPAHATDTVTRTVRWVVPANVSQQDASRFNQQLLPAGAPVPCGALVQVDTYTGTPAQLDAIVKDKVLTPGEDSLVYRGNTWQHGAPCAPVARPKPAPVKVWTKRVQVDRYLNPTAALRKAAAGYDNDGLLTFREDRAHYGHSKWIVTTVTVRSAKAPTAAQWIAAVNAKTPASVGDVKTTTKAASAGSSLTVAWEIRPGSWQDSRGGKPQVFLARS